MKKIYETQEWKGNGKQNYYHNEYRTDGDKVYKVNVIDGNFLMEKKITGKPQRK